MAPRRSWWTWNLGRIAGIPIRMHVTLFILLAWIAAAYAMRGAGARGTAIGVGMVAAIFVLVVIHELGHALVARRFGIATRDIMLLPIGGIASLEHMPDKPIQELVVAAVGPFINLAIAGLCFLGRLTSTAGSLPNELWSVMIYINVVLAVFNLLPAFPMDGGRVLRSLLAMRMSRDRATDIAAGLGKFFAFVIGFLGLLYNPLLLIIAFVVWMGANQERAIAQLKHVLAGVPVSAAMLRHFEVVTPDQPLEQAAALLTQGGVNELPVIDHGRPVGVLTRRDVASALAHAGPDATVATAPTHDIVEVAPEDALDAVIDHLRVEPDSIALVVDHGVPVGVLTAEQLTAYVEMHAQRPRSAA